MLRYKVPQNVQREDTILWFITMRQLMLMLAGFGVSYFLFTSLSKAYILSPVESFLCWVPSLITAAFAFLKIKRISLMKFVLLCLEQFVFRPRRRFWDRHSEVFVSMTTQYSQPQKTKKIVTPKNVSNDKIKNLAALIDHGKSATLN